MGLLAVTFATKSVLANLERRSKAFSLENGDLGREIFRFGFSVDVGASKLVAAVKEGGDSWQLSSSDCENVRFFSEITLKIEVSENERDLIPTPGQGMANKDCSLQLTLAHSSIADPTERRHVQGFDINECKVGTVYLTARQIIQATL